MPTLLEKSPLNPVPAIPPSELLRRRHLWERWRGFLFTLLAGFTVTLLVLGAFHFHWQTPGNWKIAAGIWAGGSLLTLLASLVGWRFAPASLLDTAQQMDRDLTAKNRLEASATLHGVTSPLAQAQREETTDYLRRQPEGVRPVRALPWLVAGVLVVLLVHLATLAVWVIPALPKSPKPPAPPPSPHKELPKAMIVWQKPEPETKANPIEEVPTVAIVDSNTGLKNMSLEISVNGVPKTSRPLPAAPFDKAGKNVLKTSLYMDELGVEPFDVVSYYIRGRRITDQKVGDTTSAIQFVQVRPFRNDVTQMRGGDSLQKSYDLLIRLKLAELRSIKENFVLAHTDLAVDDPVRAKENERVGKNQSELSAKTEEVVQSFIHDGISPDIIDLLRQAEPPMTDASKKILTAQNLQALPSQEKALSLIVEVEKFFHKVMVDKGSAPPSNNPDDPFKDKQQHELKKRMALATGQLETLSKNQTKLSDDMNRPDAHDAANLSPDKDKPDQPSSGGQSGPGPTSPPSPGATNPDGSQKEIPLPPTQAVDPFGPDTDKGTMAARQARIVQGIEALLNGNQVLPPPVEDALQQAQKDATASMQELDQSNIPDGREPAANAAQDLQNAIAEMLKAGDKDTKLAMETGQQQLNDLARQLRDLAKAGPPDAAQRLSNMAQQLHDVRKGLEDAADKQQESGSASGAQRLNHLAKVIAEQKVEPDLAGMAHTGLDANKAETDADKLNALAAQAAQGQMNGKPSVHDIANLIDSLERSRANLARLAQRAGVPLPTPDGQPGTAPGQNQTPTNSGAHGAGKTPDTAQQGTGKGEGKGKGKDQQPGQGQQPGPGQGQQPGQDDQPGDQSGDALAPGSTGSGGLGSTSDSHVMPSAVGQPQEYGELVAELQDEAQLTKVTVPDAHPEALMQAVAVSARGSSITIHHPTALILSGDYQGIAMPLDQLILELKKALDLAQRSDVVKQPNLDEAPPAYRSAVSDYFEAMSKNYHPDKGDSNAKKP